MMKLKNKFLSILLCLCMILTCLSGCGRKKQGFSNDVSKSVSREIVDQVVDEINSEINDEIEKTEKNHVSTENIITTVFSTNWEDYIGDVETFVYGLLMTQLGQGLDVFSAYVTLESGDDVFGIAYTDYSECYTDENEENCVFTVGFIADPEEISIPKDEIEQGLQVFNVDDGSIDGYSFVWGYTSDRIEDHCVVYNQYLKYGISEEGKVFYSAVPYEKDVVDESIGSLYSYDEAKYLLNFEVGNHDYLTGSSLFTDMEFGAIEDEINKVLEEQDLNFATVDIESYVYVAEKAVTSYLFDLQEEEFLGYKCADLIEAAAQLDPLEVIRVTPNDLQTIDLKKCGETTAIKTLVGVGTAIIAAASIAISPALLECPPLSALTGTLAGTAIEIFMQVVISNEKLNNISWTKVAVASATGAISGFIGPYVQVSKFNNVGRFVIDSSLDGLMGGMEKTVYGFMEEKKGKELVADFGFGVALAFGMSAGVKGVLEGAGKIAGKLAEKVSPMIKKNKINNYPKLFIKIAKLADGLGKRYGKLLKKINQVADSTVFHSKYVQKKAREKQRRKLLEDGIEILKKKSFTELKKNAKSLEYLDTSGNKMSIEEIIKKFDEVENNTTLAILKIDGEVIEVRKVNNIAGFFYDESKYATVIIPEGLTATLKQNGKWSREVNFENAARELKNKWLKDSSTMPESIADAIYAKGVALKDLETDELVEIISHSDFVLHENIDMQSVTLVSRKLHDFVKGGVHHMGGFAMAKYFKQHMGKEFFERFTQFASSQAAAALQ